MADEHRKPMHIAVFPWLAFGHMIPFLNFSKLIAQKGHKVSFISTPRNIDRLPKLTPEFASSVSFVKISPPKIDQLPERAEATIDIQGHQMDLLKKAFDGLEPGLTRFLEESAPDWVVYDLAHWLPPIATRLGISRALLMIVSPWFLAYMGPVDTLISGSDDRTRIEDFMSVPEWVDFQTTVAFRHFEAKWVHSACHTTNCGITDFLRTGKAIHGSEVFLVRHCHEFEPDQRIINLLQKIDKVPVLPVGLLMPPELENNASDDGWLPIKGWLDSQSKGSVVYVALGSEINLSQDQLTELALGLELSGVPFFWVLRGENESFSLPCEFETRTKGRGIVWRQWAPQLTILGHETIGGFLTHCGFGSVMETLKFGHPLIALPFLVDQGLVARLVVEKGLGCEIPRNDEDGSYTRDSVADSIRLVMIQDEGKAFREKAKDLSADMFGDTGRQDKYMIDAVKFLQNHT